MADGARCLIYTRISKDKLGEGHGVANQLADLEKRARARGWTVVYRLSDNDIGVTRKDPTAAGRHRPGWAEALRLVDAGAVDVVLCWRWDRALREPLDLEYLIPRFDKAGVRFAEADGIIDLGTDSGRLAARILIAVAKAEQERKSERQRLANEAAAVRGKRRLGTPRPFGYCEDRVTAHPAEGPAVAQACAVVLGGGTLSAVMREWTKAGVRPVQSRSGRGWTRQSIRVILMNPRIAGLSAYRGEIVGTGRWEPLVSEETWRAVRGVLDDPSRKPQHGVRTLLGGLALCPCGNVVTGMPSHTGHHIYRCAPASKNQSWRGGHVARLAAPVEDFIARLVIGRLSRPDAADLVTVPEGGPDVAALREESAAIRRNLEDLAADRALGLVSRAQMLAATERGNVRLGEIGTDLDAAARENVLAPLAAAENAAAVWEDLDLARQRAVIKTLMSVTLCSPGKGARRAFDPGTVQVAWRHG
ncbi:MAG TPA: recombinase family protein [Streptosporangiaceae bacterium]|nr:recombinase family protein [Streptosporangiaceae bacterium]